MNTRKTSKLTQRVIGAALSAVLICSAAVTSASAAVLADNSILTTASATAGKISLSKTALTIARGNTASLTVKFSDSVKTKITWSSSDKTVCTVSDGTITAKSAGTAVITAKTPDGRTAKCTVTVVVKPKSIKLDKTSLNVYKNSSVTLKATVYPSSTTNKTVKWISSKPSIASVSSQGIVTGISKGKATITAIASNGLKATAVVNVIIPASGISLKKSSAVIGAGEEIKLSPVLTPASSNDKITYVSSNTKIASVSNGIIKGKACGTAVIKASIPNGKSALFTVTVKKAPEWVWFQTVNVALGAGETYIPDVMLPDGSACSKLIYTTTDSSVFTVSAGGKVTAKNAGKAYLTVQTYNGQATSTAINVSKAPTSIRLSDTSKTLSPKQTTSLKVIFNSGEMSRKLKFTSSNTAVCTVDQSGLVTAKAAGTAVITARTFNGKTASCKITVKSGISDSEFRTNFNKLKNYILSHYEDTDENGDKYIRYAHPGSTEDSACYVVFIYMASQNKIRIEDCIINEKADILVSRAYIDYNNPSKVNVEVSQMNLAEIFTNPIGYTGTAVLDPSNYTRTTKLNYTFTTGGNGTPDATVYSKFKQTADSQLLNSLLFANSKLSTSGSGVTLAKLGFTALK